MQKQKQKKKETKTKNKINRPRKSVSYSNNHRLLKANRIATAVEREQKHRNPLKLVIRKRTWIISALFGADTVNANADLSQSVRHNPWGQSRCEYNVRSPIYRRNILKIAMFRPRWPQTPPPTDNKLKKRTNKYSNKQHATKCHYIHEHGVQQG